MREQVDYLMNQALKLLAELEVMWDNSMKKLSDKLNSKGENQMVTKNTTISLTVEQIQAVFTEWDKRYRENPNDFMNEAYHLLFTDEEDYGAQATPYFLSIVDDMFNDKEN